MTTAQISQITNHGLSQEQVEAQLENFRRGFEYLSINRAAITGDGIVAPDKSEVEHFISTYDKFTPARTTVKFVPASGAATRMFKELFEFITDGTQSCAIDTVSKNLDKFAFGAQLQSLLEPNADQRSIIEGIVRQPLEYGKQPKALILFHKYKEGTRTAAEEHLCEGAIYAAGAGSVKIHFTVSPEHHKGFEELFKRVVESYQKRYGVKYEITFSYQKSSTDTIAVTPDNQPFLNEDGTLLFRPAGHGALIENLNDIDADTIFIKTVDNVAPDRLKPDTIKYKKVLGGMLYQTQGEIFSLIAKLEKEPTAQNVTKAAKFVESTLGYKLPPMASQKSLKEQAALLCGLLDRPLRICGMVKNEGEPGGGPFWVNGEDGSQSLQIAESSQISPTQIILMKQATHFNPVDIVCAVKDAKGRKYDLTKYVDPSTGFISEKSKDGRKLKAQELPGLWNGAMANWNTIFVEVPISTFSPVKVVTDLLRVEHQ